MRLRLLTLNTWGLPFGLARDLPRRTEALGATFAESGADVIALQEVWTARARSHLVAAAAEAGYGHAFFVDRPRGNAGLVVLSRWPFTRGEAAHFRVRGRAERVHHGDFWAGKGWLDLGLDTPAGPVRLVDTHLHAAYGDGSEPDEYTGERMAQVVELAHTLRDRAWPLVAVGDFNMLEGSEEYAVWRSLAGVTDVAAALDARRVTVQGGHLYVNDHSDDQRIDYAFLRDGAEARLRPVAIERVFDEPIDLGGREGRYSDHHGLRIDLEIEAGASNAPEAASDPSDPEQAIGLARRRLEEAAERTEARAGRQTTAGIAGLVVSSAAGFAADLRTRDRRTLLRVLAFGLPALGVVASGLTVTLGSGFTSSSARRFLDVARLLRDF